MLISYKTYQLPIKSFLLKNVIPYDNITFIMRDLIRTSITIPENVFIHVRILAAQKGESVSKYITRMLREKTQTPYHTQVKDPMSLLGVYNVTDKSPRLYTSRSELYEDHLTRKMEGKVGNRQ